MGWDGASPQTNDCSQGEAWKMSERKSRVGFQTTGRCKMKIMGNP